MTDPTESHRAYEEEFQYGSNATQMAHRPRVPINGKGSETTRVGMDPTEYGGQVAARPGHELFVPNFIFANS